MMPIAQPGRSACRPVLSTSMTPSVHLPFHRSPPRPFIPSSPPTRCPERLVMRTSENWWEDEEEFDSLTDSILPKKVFLVAFESGKTTMDVADSLRDFFSPLVLNTAFSKESTQEAADRIWEGRNKPPLFLKVRRRESLDSGDFAAFAREIYGQNWPVGLEAGLGKQTALFEGVLVVGDAPSMSALASAILGGGTRVQLEGGQVAVVGTREGAAPQGADFLGLAPKLEETIDVASLAAVCTLKQF